jgi:hypothetical protein
MATGSAVFSQIQAYNLLWYRGGGVVAVRDGVSFEEARARIAASLPDMTGWSAGDVNARYVSEGLTLIRDHPGLFLRNQAFGFVKLVTGPGRSDLGHYVSGISYARVAPEAIGLDDGDSRLGVSGYPASRIAVLYSIAYTALLYAGVCWGVVVVLRQQRPMAPHVVLWAITVYLLIMAAGPESYADPGAVRGRRLGECAFPICESAVTRVGERTCVTVLTPALVDQGKDVLEEFRRVAVGLLSVSMQYFASRSPSRAAALDQAGIRGNDNDDKEGDSRHGDVIRIVLAALSIGCSWRLREKPDNGFRPGHREEISEYRHSDCGVGKHEYFNNHDK